MFLEIGAWLAAAGLGLEPSDNFPTGFLHDSVHRRNFETQKRGANDIQGTIRLVPGTERAASGAAVCDWPTESSVFRREAIPQFRALR